MHNATENADLPDYRPWLPTGEVKMSMIVLPLVIKNERLHASIRGLALHMLQCTYCNIGFWFKSLSDADVAYLLHRVKTSEYESRNERSADTSAIQEMILLTLLLGRAEGKTEIDPLYISEATPNLSTLIRIEDMHRKDKLKVNYLNYSLTDINKPVVLGKTAVELAKIFKERDE